MTALRIGELFSGYGGLGMGVQAVLGGEIAWHSEIDPGACKILAHRYPDVSNLGDITTVDWSQVEPVDVLALGFPCTDVSCAGLRLGLTPTTRSGLWSYAAQAIAALRPPLVVIENVRGLLSADAQHPAHRDHFHPVHGNVEPCPWCVGDGPSRPLRALGAVLGDLADIGYDASWQGLRAADIGAPHGRFRVFVVAWPAADTDNDAARGRRQPGHARGGRAELAQRGATAPHSADNGREWRGRAWHGRSGSADHGDAAADADHRTHDRERARTGSRVRGAVDWGPYGNAIARWESLTRPAPSPTESGKSGPRLSARFVEWMQGLPEGWVTDVPGLSRNDQLKALGNGVVPAQAAQALRMLLADRLDVAA